jgi:hypothetical protein
MNHRAARHRAAALLAALALPATAQDRGLKLHVPSPDGRDQVMHFVLTDRFDGIHRRLDDVPPTAGPASTTGCQTFETPPCVTRT